MFLGNVLLVFFFGFLHSFTAEFHLFYSPCLSFLDVLVISRNFIVLLLQDICSKKTGNVGNVDPGFLPSLLKGFVTIH